LRLFVLETEFVVVGSLQRPDFSAWRFWQTQNGTVNPPHSKVQAHWSLRATPPIFAQSYLPGFALPQGQDPP